jgi:hypothetical protein
VTSPSTTRTCFGFALYALSCALIGIGAAVRRERRNAQIASQQVRIVTDTMAVGVTRAAAATCVMCG